MKPETCRASAGALRVSSPGVNSSLRVPPASHALEKTPRLPRPRQVAGGSGAGAGAKRWPTALPGSSRGLGATLLNHGHPGDVQDGSWGAERAFGCLAEPHIPRFAHTLQHVWALGKGSWSNVGFSLEGRVYFCPFRRLTQREGYRPPACGRRRGVGYHLPRGGRGTPGSVCRHPCPRRVTPAPAAPLTAQSRTGDSCCHGQARVFLGSEPFARAALQGLSPSAAGAAAIQSSAFGNAECCESPGRGTEHTAASQPLRVSGTPRAAAAPRASARPTASCTGAGMTRGSSLPRATSFTSMGPAAPRCGPAAAKLHPTRPSTPRCPPAAGYRHPPGAPWDSPQSPNPLLHPRVGRVHGGGELNFAHACVCLLLLLLHPESSRKPDGGRTCSPRPENPPCAPWAAFPAG